ncbi:lasso RiPP family leader peptide-containing protein [Gordonia terrae]
MTVTTSKKTYQAPKLRVIGSFRRATRGTGAWSSDGDHIGRSHGIG